MLIDTHCHLDDVRFDNERAQIIARAKASGVSRLITIGCDISNSIRAMGIAATHLDVFFSAGIHPHEAAKTPDDFVHQLQQIAKHPRCVAIGECGLDYYYHHSSKETQLLVFENQIRLAHQLQKALIIHVRDAWEDCILVLKNHQQYRTKTIIHCFTGTIEQAKQMIDLGCILSISGIVTFKQPGDLHQVVTKIPLDNFLIETDSPYLAPIPHRGKRNEPSYVYLVAKKIAELKQIPIEDVILQTGENAKAIFGI